MDKDIAPELIEKVNRNFDANLKKDKVASALSDKLAAGQAKFDDAYRYAESVGNARAKAFEAQISSEALPEGKMHYNIASRLMEDSLTTDHNMVAEYAAEVQKSYNDKVGIRLKSLQADVDKDRIDGFVQRLASEDNFDDVKWIMQEPVVTHARSVVDDTIKKNAEFQYKAGLKATVIRIADSKCCEWCADLAGDYTYPNVPREVFQRHDNCKCTVDYEGKKLQAYNSGGKAHTFREQDEQKKIEERKNFEKDANKRLEETKANRRAIIESEKRARGYIGKPLEKADNQHVREWYVANVSNIPNLIDRTASIEEQARQAFELRNRYKREARAAMLDKSQVRLLETYRPAPTFEQLIKGKMDNKGLTREQAIQDILKTASKTNIDVNKEFGL